MWISIIWIVSSKTATYEAYLRDDPLPSSLVARDGVNYSRAELLAGGWVQVASVSAHAEDTYLMVAPTDADSTVADGQHYSVFYVRAATAAPWQYDDSAPDSGYSLDNIAPDPPASFAYDTGQLSWDQSNATDFDYFTVYGSNTGDFGAATIVDYTTALGLDVSSSPYVYYYVTATDFSGNEGTPSTINTLTSVGGTPAGHVLSISAYPNPFNPATTIRYTLPSAGHVTVVVYDASGARVATLVDGERDSDAYTARWDGRSDAGTKVSSGVYFARIEHNGVTRVKKMVLLK
jgi:hypothetical protein